MTTDTISPEPASGLRRRPASARLKAWIFEVPVLQVLVVAALAAWLVERGCTHVAMESTGVYWLPIYNVLEGQVEVWLVNAKPVQPVPGRKRDQSDAAWLAQRMQ